ncbi:MAG: ABC transporter ATP-binding protein [Prevotellaceae bacterium]|jgi:ABC-type multidrug transport system ATPase subunit|nr:ABC transporter ATP-binding protein [Prevotellaceae bacterium]
MIEVKNISKKYGAVQALDDVCLSVREGELFGLIGPDGAGKTSLLRILATLLAAGGGSAKVDGFDVQRDYLKIRRCTGYMPGRFSLYQDLSVEENLAFFATIFGVSVRTNYDLIRPVYAALEPFRKRRAGALSGGMKQKLALCCALVHRPSVLLLDEPTTGVDAVSRAEFWGMLKKLKQYGVTILVSTPYMDEAGRCERVAFIQRGRILQTGTPQDIIQEFPHRIHALHSDDAYRLLCDLQRWPHLHSVYPFGYYAHLIDRRNVPADAVTDELTGFLSQRGHAQIECRPVPPTIEDCFMEYARS